MTPPSTTGLQAILRDVDLRASESALYLAALAHGETYMSVLARSAGLKRSNAYAVFRSLEARGLMATSRGPHGARYAATDPDVLARGFEQKAERLRGALPQLRALTRATGVAPRITSYEGREGYMVAMEQSLVVPGVTIRHIGSLREANRVIDETYVRSEYVPRRVAQRIALHALYFARDPLATTVAKSHAEDLREVRLLPESARSSTSTYIYGDTVAIFSGTDELVTVIIESASIAETERKRFDLLWDLVGPMQQKRRG